MTFRKENIYNRTQSHNVPLTDISFGLSTTNGHLSNFDISCRNANGPDNANGTINILPFFAE